MSSFATVASYLEDPLVLGGFALFLFFGALRFTIKRLPAVSQKIAGIAVLRLVTFGFVLALAVIVLGFVLRYMEVQSEAARVAAQHRAELAEQANEALQKQNARLVQDLDVEREQSKALTKAVTALAAHKGNDIDNALEELAKGNTEKAKVAFRKITEKGEADIKETAAVYRHIGALAFFDDTEEALTAYKRAVELDPENLDGWYQLGILYFRVGQLHDAVAAYKTVVVLAGANNDASYVAASLGNLGKIYEILGNLGKAEEIHLRRLALSAKLDDLAGVAASFGGLGNIYHIRGSLSFAEQMYGKALAINKELRDKAGMADNYSGLGIVYMTLDDLRRSEEMHLKALSLNRDLTDKEGMANDYSNLGIVYQKQGHLERAEEMHKKSLDIEVALGHKAGIAADYANLGIVYEIQGDLERAEEMYVNALNLEEELGHKEGIANNYANLGMVYHTRGEHNRARSAWQKSLVLYTNIDSPYADTVQRWLRRLESSLKNQ